MFQSSSSGAGAGESVERERTADGPARVAIAGTLAEFRPDPVPYDLRRLVRFVERINPDLLCLDMTLDQWRQGDFGGLPAEYRDALLPLAQQTDIVVVPIGDDGAEEAAVAGGRGWLDHRLRAALAAVQLGSHSPVAVDAGPRHWIAELLFHLVDRPQGRAGRRVARAHRDRLMGRIVELAGRDPGRRILAVVNARHCHPLRRALRRHMGLTLVRYSRL